MRGEGGGGGCRGVSMRMYVCLKVRIKFFFFKSIVIFLKIINFSLRISAISKNRDANCVDS